MATKGKGKGTETPVVVASPKQSVRAAPRHRDRPKASQCTAKSKTTGERCKRPATAPLTVCRYHGGKSLSGAANPAFKHGRYISSLPTRMLADFEAALKDPQLLSTRSDIAVLVARQEDLLRRVDSGEAGALWREARAQWKTLSAARSAGDRPAEVLAEKALDEVLGKGAADYVAWDELIKTTEEIRRLRESERKLIEAHAATMTAEQLATLVAALTSSLRSHVKDPKVLDAIGRDVERLIAQPRSA